MANSHKNLNLLYRTRCYLAGPMQYTETGRQWRDKVKKELLECNITFLDPYHKPFVTDVPEDELSREELLHWMDTGQYELVQTKMWAVRGYDLRCVDLSDFLIVYVDPKIPTWGTVEEVTTAVREKKPVFMAIEGGKKKTPLWIFGKIPHKYIYDNIDDIIKTIKAIDSGIIPCTSDRWKLLKKELR